MPLTKNEERKMRNVTNDIEDVLYFTDPHKCNPNKSRRAQRRNFEKNRKQKRNFDDFFLDE